MAARQAEQARRILLHNLETGARSGAQQPGQRMAAPPSEQMGDRVLTAANTASTGTASMVAYSST